MLKPVRFLLYAVAALFGILVISVVAVLLFFDVNAYKPKLEAVASELSGMQVTLGGKMNIGIFPGVSVVLHDVHVRNRGADVVDAGRVAAGLDLWPLVHGNVRVHGLSLKQVSVSIERGPDGRFNFQNPGTKPGLLPAVKLAGISVSDATFRYIDKQSGLRVDAAGCDVDVDNAGLAGGSSSDLAKILSLKAHVDCAKLHTSDITATGLAFPLTAEGGLIDAKPVTMTLFGGHGSGSLHADFSGDTPVYRLDFSIAGFDAEKALQAVAPHGKIIGKLDFSTRLSLQGTASTRIERRADGTVSLHGENLALPGINLDDAIENFKSSQSFSLVDAGAFLLVGPFGVALTKGYDFASITQATQGSTRIRKLVSDWRIGNGLAKTQDVAMATEKNRLAVKGAVDLVNKRYNDLTVAVVNARGCALVEQRIHGSFEHPVIEQPNVLQSLAGPAVKLFGKVRDLLPHDKCDVFYAGSVAAPGG